jgi:AcrR family transcriptional regulator
MTDQTGKGAIEQRPRRKNDPAGTRARILEAAFDLFQVQGYNATSVQEIAAAAGVTGGALHHHFSSKKALGLAVIGERVAAAVDEVWLEPVRNAATAREGILRVFETLAGDLDNQGSVRGCPVNNLTLELAFADPEFRAELLALFDRWRTTISDKLKADGKPEPEGIAVTVVAAYSGAMAIAKVEQRGEPLRLCARQLKALL